MKKTMIAAILITGLAFSSAASAKWGQGGGYGYNNGMQGQGMQRQMAQQLDPAAKEKLDQFFVDTQDLHKQMAIKQAERRAMMQAANPDVAAAGKITGEIFDLRTTIRAKAAEAGVDQYLGPRGMGRGGKKGGMRQGGRGQGQGRMGGQMMQYQQNG